MGDVLAMRLSEWDVPRTVAKVKAKLCPSCMCDPLVRFRLDTEDMPYLDPIHDADCPEAPHRYTVDVWLHGVEAYPCVICGKFRQEHEYPAFPLLPEGGE